MKQAHFLGMLFKKRRKGGGYREIKNINGPKQEKVWAKGEKSPRSKFNVVFCSHCREVVDNRAPIGTLSGICSNCITRERLARIQV